MEKVILDYKLDFSQIQFENLSDICNKDINELKGSFNGKIYIFFQSDNFGRNYIILETGIIDYLIQFKNVIAEIEIGNYTPFSVSCDFYNNNFHYKYDKTEDVLTIYEINGGDFIIKCKFSAFKKGILNFEKKVITEFIVLFPKLLSNKFFVNLIPKGFNKNFNF